MQILKDSKEVKELPYVYAKAYISKLGITECKHCKTDLKKAIKMDYYPHGNGWKVPGLENLQWLILYCPGCNFGFSLWKLGVDKNVTIDDNIDIQKFLGKGPGMVFCPECKKAIEISTPDKYEALKNHVDIFHPGLFDD